MWRWQKEVLPRAPLTQKDLDAKLEYFFSDKGKHLVLGDEIDENGKRIMTFGNPEDLIYFKESKRLNIDTTFKSAVGFGVYIASSGGRLLGTSCLHASAG